MAYRSTYRRQSQDARGALVTARQMAALGKMAEANGFADGSALLCDVASCDLAELGRKSRPVVQMFVDQAFQRYGRVSSPARAGSRYACTQGGARMTMSSQRCEDAPCCGCCD